MPYGSQSKGSTRYLMWESVQPGLKTVKISSHFLDTLVETRTGTNRNTLNLRGKRRTQQPLSWKLVPVKTRVKRKVRYQDRRGRWRDKWVSVEHMRLKQVPVWGKPPKVYSDLLVNNLTLTSHRVNKTSGDSSISMTAAPQSSYPGGKTFWIAGDTAYLGNSFPSGFGTGSPSVFHPNAYTAGYLSTDYLSYISPLQSKALQSVYEKAKNQNVNLLNMLAEIGQTKSAFAGIVERLKKVILALLKRRVGEAVLQLLPNSTRDLANDTLLWNFGVKPLLMDLDGLAKTMAEGIPSREIVVKSAQSRTIRTTQTGQASSSILYRKETLAIETEITVRSVLRYKCKVPGTQLPMSLGLTNLVSTVWEVTPWSFVFDWIIPIGKWLDTMDTELLLEPVSYHETTVVKQKVMCVAVHNGRVGNVGAYVDCKGKSSVWEVENVYVSRQLKTLPTPPLPSFRNPNSLYHAILSLSLLRQQLHSIK